MKRTWTKDVPEKEGWYFWKARERTSDPFYWTPYFVCDESGGEYLSFWEGGTAMDAPKGGFWSPVLPNVPKEIESFRNVLATIKQELMDDTSLGYHKWVIDVITKKLGDT